MRPLRPDTDLRLGGPLPRQLANQPRPPLQTHCCFDLAVLCGISPGFPSYSPFGGRLVTCYSPGRHFTQGLLPFLVRLACVRHAASVDSEPGSNSRLKPDVCRRVVGRLPSPGIESGLQKPFWFQQPGWRHRSASAALRRKEVHGGLSCEIARTNARMFLTTGTFNLVVKDRIAVRRGGAHSVQAKTLESISDCPRNFTNIQCGVNPVNHALPTEFPDDFHIGKYSVEERQQESKGSVKARNSMAFRSALERQFGEDLCCSPDGRQKIEKRSLLLGGPCFEGTLRKALRKTCFAFRIESRGRDN